MSNCWFETLDDFLARAKVHYSACYVRELKSKLGMLATWATAQGITLEEFKDSHLDRYLGYRMDKGAKERSLETDAMRAKLFFRYCREQQIVMPNPLQNYKVKKSPKPHVPMPDTDYLRRLLRAVGDRWDMQKTGRDRKPNRWHIGHLTPKQRRFYRSRDYAVISGLIETGCRAGELCGLLLKDFDGRNLQIVFRETKGGEPRALPISKEWADAVREWLVVRPQVASCATLFMTKNGLPMSPGVIENQWEEYEKYAGLDTEEAHRTRHGVRHWAITHTARISLVTAMRKAGHKDPNVTRGYLHNDPEQIREDSQKANLLGKVTNSEQKTQRRKSVI